MISRGTDHSAPRIRARIHEIGKVHFYLFILYFHLLSFVRFIPSLRALLVAHCLTNIQCSVSLPSPLLSPVATAIAAGITASPHNIHAYRGHSLLFASSFSFVGATKNELSANIGHPNGSSHAARAASMSASLGQRPAVYLLPVTCVIRVRGRTRTHTHTHTKYMHTCGHVSVRATQIISVMML